MSSELENERESLLKRLRDAAFGRMAATGSEIGRWIHRLGTINRQIDKD